jgi:NAD(P)-dependent dehydrogenase (short-subunit alcohol dehydrogenase family)
MSDSRRIVITGVSRGLGLAMTEESIRRGHVVLGCARSSAAVAGLRKRFAAPHDFDVVDVSQDAQLGAWAARSALR